MKDRFKISCRLLLATPSGVKIEALCAKILVRSTTIILEPQALYFSMHASAWLPSDESKEKGIISRLSRSLNTQLSIKQLFFENVEGSPLNQILVQIYNTFF